MKKIFLLLAAALTIGAASAQNPVYLAFIPENTSLRAGESTIATLTITQNDSQEEILAGFFSVKLPAGLSIVDVYEDADGEPCNYEWLDRVVYSSEVLTPAYNNETYKWAMYNPQARAIRIMTGGLYNVTIQADDTFEGGDMVMDVNYVTNSSNKDCPGGNDPDYATVAFTNPDASGPTAIDDVNANKTVASQRYFNIAGVEMNEAAQGVNIVVTTYTDGTTSTAKVLK